MGKVSEQKKKEKKGSSSVWANILPIFLPPPSDAVKKKTVWRMKMQSEEEDDLCTKC